MALLPAEEALWYLELPPPPRERIGQVVVVLCNGGWFICIYTRSMRFKRDGGIGRYREGGKRERADRSMRGREERQGRGHHRVKEAIQENDKDRGREREG